MDFIDGTGFWTIGYDGGGPPVPPAPDSTGGVGRSSLMTMAQILALFGKKKHLTTNDLLLLLAVIDD